MEEENKPEIVEPVSLEISREEQASLINASAKLQLKQAALENARLVQENARLLVEKAEVEVELARLNHENTALLLYLKYGGKDGMTLDSNTGKFISNV